MHTCLMFAVSRPYGVPMKQIVPRYVEQFGASVLQMTFRAAKKKEQVFRGEKKVLQTS